MTFIDTVGAVMLAQILWTLLYQLVKAFWPARSSGQLIAHGRCSPEQADRIKEFIDKINEEEIN